ncbi:hypothetical protein ACP4OV_020631 [Aristida adscensionis]
MAGEEVNLQWITNDSKRHATFRKRCDSLKKKSSELVTLCNVKVCVVAYGEGEAQPEVWPSVSEATRLLNLHKNMPNLESMKKTMNMEEFLQKRIAKLEAQVKNSADGSDDPDALLLLHKALTGNGQGLADAKYEELQKLDNIVNTLMSRAEKRLQQLTGGQGPLQQQELPLHQQPLSASSSIQPQVPNTSTLQSLVGVQEALLEPKPLLMHPNLPPMSSNIPQMLYTSTEMLHGWQAPVEEHQPQQHLQNWLMDKNLDGSELDVMEHKAFGGNNNIPDPSGRGNGKMEPFDLGGSQYQA